MLIGGKSGLSTAHCLELRDRSTACRYAQRWQTSQDCADRLGYHNQNKGHLFPPTQDLWATRVMRHINETWPHVEHSLTNLGRSAQALDQFMNGALHALRVSKALSKHALQGAALNRHVLADTQCVCAADCMTELCPNRFNLVIIESQAIPLNAAELEAILRFWASRPGSPALMSLSIPRLGGWLVNAENYWAVLDCLVDLRNLTTLRETLGRSPDDFPACADAYSIGAAPLLFLSNCSTCFSNWQT